MDEIINVDSLSYKELILLENKIKQRKSNLKELRVYQVTFSVAFVATEHDEDDLDDPESFGEWVANCSVYDEIADTFNIDNMTHITGCDVVELDKCQYPKMFKELIGE